MVISLVTEITTMKLVMLAVLTVLYSEETSATTCHLCESRTTSQCSDGTLDVTTLNTCTGSACMKVKTEKDGKLILILIKAVKCVHSPSFSFRMTHPHVLVSAWSNWGFGFHNSRRPRLLNIQHTSPRVLNFAGQVLESL